MALNAYSGIRATTFRLKNAQTNQLINLSTKITTVKPLLTTPFLLDLISNNSTKEGDIADFVNLRFYYTKKSEDTGTLLSDDSGTVLADPSLLETEEIEVIAAQLAPVDVGKKLGFSNRDLSAEGLENAAATKLAGFLEQRRAVKSAQLFNLAIQAAFTVQQEVKATTSFDDGAHYVVENLSGSGEKIYASLESAINAFKILGLENAVPKYNADIQMVLGVPETDMAILISLKCYANLLKMPGLFASDAGFEQFKKLNFKEFLGIPLIPVANLPLGVNFMVITTGSTGALHYSTCGDLSSDTPGAKKIGVNANLTTKPGWSFDYRIDIVDRYRIGVVLPQLIFVSALKEPIISKSDLKNKSSQDLNSISAGINNNIKNIDEKILELKTKIDLYKNHIELNKDKLDKDKINKAKDAIAIFGKEITSLKNEKADLLAMFKKTNNKIETSLSKEEEAKIITLEELSV